MRSLEVIKKMKEFVKEPRAQDKLEEMEVQEIARVSETFTLAEATEHIALMKSDLLNMARTGRLKTIQANGGQHRITPNQLHELMQEYPLK